MPSSWPERGRLLAAIAPAARFLPGPARASPLTGLIQSVGRMRLRIAARRLPPAAIRLCGAVRRPATVKDLIRLI